MDEIEISIIGAGVVGLAIAAELAPRHPVFVFERNPGFGQETSSRNSEVIHAGLYYPPGSLKARLCVEGSRQLYQICASHGIAHRALGKLVVAVGEREIPQLDELYRNGQANGATLEMLTGPQVRAREPAVRALAVVFSPRTGIIDSHGLMRYYEGLARENQARFVYGAEVVGLERRLSGLEVTLRDAGGLTRFVSRVVINAAGLQSDRVAALAGIEVDAAGYRLRYCKGDYFSVGRPLTRGLVYPVPDPAGGGLGIHVTPGLEGRVRLGPDAIYVDAVSYRVDDAKRESFFRSVKAFLPGLREEELEPDFAGVRPKLQGPGEGFRDFIIRRETDRGLPGLINLVGIESPGLTASPAIARHVRALVEEALA